MKKIIFITLVLASAAAFAKYDQLDGSMYSCNEIRNMQFSIKRSDQRFYAEHYKKVCGWRDRQDKNLLRQTKWFKTVGSSQYQIIGRAAD
jgi:hypothetical protein